jgi:hypothetical protein
MTVKERIHAAAYGSVLSGEQSAKRCCKNCEESFKHTGGVHHFDGYKKGAEFGYKLAIAELKKSEDKDNWNAADWLERKLEEK